MLIRLGYDILFNLPQPTSMVAMLHVHPSRAADLQTPDTLRVEPALPLHEYHDSFGNICTRVSAPAGQLRFLGDATIADPGVPDPQILTAVEHPIDDLPDEVLQFLLSSRYCEVDLLSVVAYELFGHLPRAGRGYVLYATGCGRGCDSATSSPAPRALHSMSTQSESASAAISSIWRSLFAEH